MNNNKNALTIEQLEERYEMIVASKDSNNENLNPNEWVNIKF